MEKVEPVLEIGPLATDDEEEVPAAVREDMYSLLLRNGNEVVWGVSTCGERGGVEGLPSVGMESDGNMVLNGGFSRCRQRRGVDAMTGMERLSEEA